MDLWRRELFLLVLFYMCVFACGHSVVACQGLATTPVVLLSGFSPLHNPSRVKMVVLYELIPVALGWVRDMEMRISDLYTIWTAISLSHGGKCFGLHFLMRMSYCTIDIVCIQQELDKRQNGGDHKSDVFFHHLESSLLVSNFFRFEYHFLRINVHEIHEAPYLVGWLHRRRIWVGSTIAGFRPMLQTKIFVAAVPFLPPFLFCPVPEEVELYRWWLSKKTSCHWSDEAASMGNCETFARAWNQFGFQPFSLSH